METAKKYLEIQSWGRSAIHIQKNKESEQYGKQANGPLLTAPSRLSNPRLLRFRPPPRPSGQNHKHRPEPLGLRVLQLFRQRAKTGISYTTLGK